MLEASWEAHASTFANAESTQGLIEAIEAVVRSARIDLSKPARVVFGRDTRPSGPALVAALQDGLAAIARQSSSPRQKDNLSRPENKLSLH